MKRAFGIDIGTTFVTVYERKESSVSRYRHEGKIAETIDVILKDFNGKDTLVFTGKGGQEIAESMQAEYINEAVALSCLLSSYNKDLFDNKRGQVIDIGASSLTLYTVQEGKVVDIGQNTLCAAGTGLFLEEQADRLKIDLEQEWQLDIETPPLIASRCTVFAKSDLIHHQQEGRSKDEMWAGLCRSLVVSAVNTLFRGQELKGKIMICGGVSLNGEVVRWFKKLYPEVEWIKPKIDATEAVMAFGASYAPGTRKENLNKEFGFKKKEFKRMPPLSLKRSTYPEMKEPEKDRHNNEIRVHRKFENARAFILGMDIGSTSTKLAVLDADSYEPLLDFYGRTAGDPVNAARKIFASFYDTLGNKDIPVEAFGTTGSGRKLVGEIFGADLIVNEISAHGKGTAHFYPDVETIFEIGGQDAKYIRLKNGFVADVNMNYVCAAGTGSFVEEQARKLGFEVHEIGALTSGIAPPVTSDRCTVFMEQDLRALLKAGFSKTEALASVLYSIIQNYLNRVVGNRAVSDSKIFFQGATARNIGLVAALENLLGVEVTVSPYCHLMGSVGAALRAREFLAAVNSKVVDSNKPILPAFVGRAAINMEIQSRSELCKLCRNFCRINFVSRKPKGDDADTGEFSWGYQCGRDPEEKLRKEIPQFHLFKERDKLFQVKNQLPVMEKGTITLVNALTNHTFQPLWSYFFNRLGYNVKTTGRTDSHVKKAAAKVASGDFCFPVKVVLGHIVKAIEKKPGEGLYFLPYVIADKRQMETASSYYCPYVEGSASIVKSTLTRNGIKSDNLLSPVIDFRHSPREIGEALFSVLKGQMDVKKKQVITALEEAYNYWETSTLQLEESGMADLEELMKSDKPVFIMVGRPYNLHDNGVNLGIPEKLASMGYPVIPIDMLPLNTASLAQENYYNLFWKYGQRIVAAIKIAAQNKNVFPIYLSNFNCGPDSFLLTFAEEELDGKPMLILELDEHDSDGGYLTRIQAYLDVVDAYLKRREPLESEKIPPVYTVDRSPNLQGRIWIPPLHDCGPRLYAASFRKFGFDCSHLEPEDQEALALGKKQLRGGECLPMTLTLGSFLKQIKDEDQAKQHVLFMPTAEGPCRFGQYTMLKRVVFHRLGLENVDILSPSSINSYQGLPDGLRRQLMHATMSSDILFKMLTKTRPYERTKGDTDELYQSSVRKMEEVLENGGNPLKTIGGIAHQFAGIATYNEKKPLVGVVGEIYVRSNAFSNGNLIEEIEANGGEAWLVPIHEWLVYVAYVQSIADKNQYWNLLKRGGSWVNNFYFFKTEKSYYDAAAKVLFDRHEPHMKDIVSAGGKYLPEEFEGEAILTVGRALMFAQGGADMVINAAPFSCMPGTLAGSILLEIKEKYNIPFISLFYEGDLDVNDKVASLLKSIVLDHSARGNAERVMTGA